MGVENSAACLLVFLLRGRLAICVYFSENPKAQHTDQSPYRVTDLSSLLDDVDGAIPSSLV